jgi:hypothetical protein
MMQLLLSKMALSSACSTPHRTIQQQLEVMELAACSLSAAAPLHTWIPSPPPQIIVML